MNAASVTFGVPERRTGERSTKQEANLLLSLLLKRYLEMPTHFVSPPELWSTVLCLFLLYQNGSNKKLVLKSETRADNWLAGIRFGLRISPRWVTEAGMGHNCTFNHTFTSKPQERKKHHEWKWVCVLGCFYRRLAVMEAESQLFLVPNITQLEIDCNAYATLK